MAKKPTSTGSKKTTTRAASPAAPKPATPKARITSKPAATTEVRNSAVPPRASSSTASRQLTQDMIAKRAYEIYASGTGGSEMDNWCRAERELRNELGL